MFNFTSVECYAYTKSLYQRISSSIKTAKLFYFGNIFLFNNQHV